MHHDADIYPDPYVFRPERFIEEPPGTYTFIPFGGGRRRCLGASFAMVEMRLVLRAVLSQCDLRAGSGGGAELAAAAQHHRSARRGRPGRPPRAKAGARSGMTDPAQLVTDTVRGMRRLGWFASALGALVVFQVGRLPDPGLPRPERARPTSRSSTGRWRSSTCVASGLVIQRHLDRRNTEALQWIAEGREPDEREHRRTLHLARLQHEDGRPRLGRRRGAVHAAQRLRLRLGLRRLGGRRRCGSEGRPPARSTTSPPSGRCARSPRSRWRRASRAA